MSAIDKIIKLLSDRNLQQKDLTQHIGVSAAMFSNWKNGGQSYLKYIKQIAEFLNVSSDYLLQEDENIADNGLVLDYNESTLVLNYRSLSDRSKSYIFDLVKNMAQSEAKLNTLTIKLCEQKVSAGTGYTLFEQSYDDWEDIVVLDTPQARKADFALTVDGDSMLPMFNDGDIVLVRQQPSVDIDCIGVFAVAGDGYIKKFGGDRLISLNPAYDDIVFDTEDVKCFGLVICKAELVDT